MSLKKLGRYDLIRVLGKGAMGLVYEGRDPNLDRRVAIKTIKVENLSDEAAAEYEVRFRTEARSAARLQHPNIVSVYDSDRDIDMAFLVMEFVEGDDLKHHLDKGEVYTLEQTLSIMSDLLSALNYAHQQKIVHRDVKPANLLVQASGSIKLADFGVARIQDSGDATRTQGSIVGTLKYMSPEQLEGRPIDARADLFAAGVVLYQLLTSQRPFDGDTDFAVIQKIVNHTPAAATFYNPKLPPAIDAVVAKSLAKSRDMRYATALDFSNALQAACKEATDTTIAPAAVLPAKGSNITWTATMMPGESLVATESGIGTGSGISSGTSASLVTQEVELVYWKDIKESNDIEDIQGFLVKFPSGIYADLARRRLKTLGVALPAEPTLVSPYSATAAATDMDKSVLLPKQDSAEVKSPAAPAIPVSESNSASPSPPPPPSPPPSPSPAAATASPKKAVWLIAGVAALAVVGVAFKLLSGSSPALDPAAALAPASSAAAQLPASASAVAAQAAASAAAPALVAASAARPAASSAGIAARAALAASRAAALIASKKAAADKDKPGNEVGVTQPEPSPQAARAAPAATATTPPVAGNSPRAACEDRMLLGFQTCMSEQCARPIFTQHPICIERRAMEERRREEQRSRQ
ncbi:MAG: serine/threonine-protein kinase [Polaromonas sp.]